MQLISHRDFSIRAVFFTSAFSEPPSVMHTWHHISYTGVDTTSIRFIFCSINSIILPDSSSNIIIQSNTRAVLNRTESIDTNFVYVSNRMKLCIQNTQNLSATGAPLQTPIEKFKIYPYIPHSRRKYALNIVCLMQCFVGVDALYKFTFYLLT